VQGFIPSAGTNKIKEEQKNKIIQAKLQLLDQFSYFSSALKSRLSDYKPVKVLLDEKFQNYNNGWENTNNTNYISTIEDGRYYLEDLQNSAIFKGIFLHYNNIILRCNVRFEKGEKRFDGGIFIQNNNGTIYFFGIQKNNEYSLGNNGKWDYLVNNKQNNAIYSNTINQLEILITNQTISYFINGNFIQTNSYSENLSGTMIGFFVDGPSDEFSFDNLKVIAISK